MRNDEASSIETFCQADISKTSETTTRAREGIPLILTLLGHSGVKIDLITYRRGHVSN